MPRPAAPARLGRLFLGLALLALPAALCATQETPPAAGTAPFVFDGNRIYVELAFVRPDGSLHKALAFVDMGSPAAGLIEPLWQVLQLGPGRDLIFRVGGLTVRVPADQVTHEPGRGHSVGGAAERVEAILPAGILRQYEVVIDYRRRALTLAPPGSLRAEGTPVPFRIKQDTGLLAVDATIDGKPYAITIDNGSAYTWFRQGEVSRWLHAHPDWERGRGAVGPSNMMMSGDGAEASGTLVRVPVIAAGALILRHVGALGAGPGRSPAAGLPLFDWYSTKNAVPVLGWLGGNVLRDYKLTIDYRRQVIYWLPQAQPALHDLDQVGLTLRAEHGRYFVDAVASIGGAPTVAGVQPGDRLLQVGGLDLDGASWGAIYRAMQGRPGDTRELLLQRQGRQLTVAAKVTAF